MVAQRYAKQLPGGRELLGEHNIFCAWLSLAGRVVVRHYYTCSAVNDRIRKNFPGMGKHSIERADSNGALGNKPLAAVQGKRNEMFLLAGADVVEPGNEVLLRFKRLDVPHQMTPSDFEAG